MVIYFILFIVLVVIAVEYDLGQFHDKYFFLFIILFLGLFAGLRGENIDKDYLSYQIISDFIYDLSSEDDGIFLPIFEPGFVLVVLFFRYLFDVNYLLAIMLFYGIVTVALKVFFIKKLSVFPYLAILFYFSHYYFLHEMTQIRMGLASAMFFGSLIFYQEGRRWKFIVVILLATLFHYSAIFYLVLLLFNPNNLNKHIFLFLLGASMILGYLQIPILNFLGIVDPADISGKLNAYSELVESGATESINFFNILTLVDIIICLYFFLVIPKDLLIEDKIINLSLKCSVVSIFFLAALSGVPSLAFRVSELFGLVSIFLYASLVKYLPFGKLNIVATVLLAGLTFYIIVFYAQLVNPYYINSIK